MFIEHFHGIRCLCKQQVPLQYIPVLCVESAVLVMISELCVLSTCMHQFQVLLMFARFTLEV